MKTDKRNERGRGRVARSWEIATPEELRALRRGVDRLGVVVDDFCNRWRAPSDGAATCGNGKRGVR